MTAPSETRAVAGRPARWMRGPWRRKNLRPRVLLPAAAALTVWGLARPSLASLAAGAALMGAGAALRLWATGHLVKTDHLTLSGPYRFLRHPLYAGSLLIGTGFLLSAGMGVAGLGIPAGLAFFFGYYLPYKERVECARLEERHGARFVAYRETVRALWPRRRPWSAPGDDTAWRFRRVVENDELGVLLLCALALAAMGLRG